MKIKAKEVSLPRIKSIGGMQAESFNYANWMRNPRSFLLAGLFSLLDANDVLMNFWDHVILKLLFISQSFSKKLEIQENLRKKQPNRQ